MLVGIHTWLPYAYIYYISVYNTYMGFPGGSGGKESACYAGDLGSIPGLGRSPREGQGYPFPYSGLENYMDHIVHRFTKSQTQLSDFHASHGILISHCHCHATCPLPVVSFRKPGGADNTHYSVYKICVFMFTELRILEGNPP